MLAALAVFPVVALGLTAGGAPEAQFAQFQCDHDKTYSSEAEERSRFATFQTNLEYIAAENAKGLAYTLGVGPFADLTETVRDRRLDSGPQHPCPLL